MKQLQYFVWEPNASDFSSKISAGRCQSLPHPALKFPACQAWNRAVPHTALNGGSGAEPEATSPMAAAHYQVMDEDWRIFVANSFLQISGLVLAGL